MNEDPSDNEDVIQGEDVDKVEDECIHELGVIEQQQQQLNTGFISSSSLAKPETSILEKSIECKANTNSEHNASDIKVGLHT